MARLGGRVAGVTRALQNFNDSLILHIKTDGRPGWTFAHPSLIDAYAELLRKPELLHLLAAGFPLPVLLSESTCGDVGVTNAIILPASMYDLVLDRLEEPLPPGYQEAWRERMRRMRYLSHRCDREFLEAYLSRHPLLLDEISQPGLMLSAVPGPDLVVRLHDLELLPDSHRTRFVNTIVDYFVEGQDPGVLKNPRLRSILSPVDIDLLRKRILGELVPSLDEIVGGWSDNYDTEHDSPEGYFDPVIELIEMTKEVLPDNIEVAEACDKELRWIKDGLKSGRWRDDEWREPPARSLPIREGRSSNVWEGRPGSGRSIFDDLLE